MTDIIKFVLIDFFLIALGSVIGAVLWSGFITQPKAAEFYRPEANVFREIPFQRWSFRWARTLFTVGIVYIDTWSYRDWVYPPGGGMGNCTHAIRCLTLGLFWWNLNLFWRAKLPPISSSQSADGYLIKELRELNGDENRGGRV